MKLPSNSFVVLTDEKVVCSSDKGHHYIVVFGKQKVARIGRDEARKVAA